MVYSGVDYILSGELGHIAQSFFGRHGPQLVISIITVCSPISAQCAAAVDVLGRDVDVLLGSDTDPVRDGCCWCNRLVNNDIKRQTR